MPAPKFRPVGPRMKALPPVMYSQPWSPTPSITVSNDTLIYYSKNISKHASYQDWRIGERGFSDAGINNLQIAIGVKKNGEWVDGGDLPVMDRAYSVTHPCALRNGQALYFASNMPGGLGGYDIYYIEKTSSGTWGEPINLGPTVNTEKDDFNPFYKNGLLYFSSRGHIGYGGSDIFKVSINNAKTHGEAKNLLKPINSSFDDFGFYMHPNNDDGYISSNRGSKNGYDEFYYFENYMDTSNVIGKSRFNSKILAGVNIKQEEIIYNGTVDISEKTTTNQPFNGFYMNKAKDYIISTSYNGETFIDTLFAEKHHDIVAWFGIARFSNIYFELDKYDIRDEDIPILDSMVVLLKNSEVNSEVGGHTDIRGNDEYNMVLSDKRANSIKNYLIKHGIDENRLASKGYGESVIINECTTLDVECSETKHLENRRVELKVVD